MNPSSGGFDFAAEGGVGRPFVLLYERASDGDFARHVYEQLSPKTRTILVRSPAITDDNWSGLTQELLEALRARGLRQASFVAFGAACSLVQNVCLSEAKLVRTAVFVDGASRAHPSLLSRFLDKIERALPLGLPLRLAHRGFDSRSFLQRIRCPALVVASHHASAAARADASEMAARMPTAWGLELGAEGAAKELGELVLAFSDVPARCPQKNSGGAAAGAR